ncbi:MAG TPA: sulfotransferase [Aliidongia sp.]|nr:sulfotransferase [Aliidongia sp.]
MENWDWPSPSTIEAELALAGKHYGAGDLDQAEAACQRVLGPDPENIIALLLQGEVLLARRDWPNAIATIRQAITLRPDNALGHFTLGRAFHLSRQLEAAKLSYEAAIERAPHFAMGHSNLAMLLFETGETEAAVTAGQRAVALAPDLAEAHLYLGRSLFAQRRFPESEAALRRAAALAPDHADSQTALGRTLQCMGKSVEAVACHRRALELAPVSAVGWRGLGQALHALGRFEDAATCFLRAIELDPNAGETYRDLALCRQATEWEPQLRGMAQILSNNELPVAQQIAAGFGLGKSLDDLQRYDEAFACYAEANRLARITAHEHGKRFKIEALRAEIDAQIGIFTSSLFERMRGFGIASELPVFVVGLYRSGTTLIEQILSSHPSVFGAGELLEIRQLASALRPQMAELSAEVVHRVAAEHLTVLDAMGQGATRVVDKFPDNIFSLGLIATLFPGARVIICRRDPRDNVLSCYFQQFTEGMVFTTDLADCARRYLETERMAAHWRRILPLRMLEVQYETLVADLEGEARRMIDFLGLDWHPACLSFHETERVVNTFSAWQVRQPIYSSSVGRWRNYERHLQPLFEILGDEPVGGGTG